MPPTLDDEVAFISGVNADGTLAYYSYASWNEGTNPADYSGGYTLAAKWYANAASGTAGTAGGPVAYYFDPASSWSATEQQEFRAGLALWAAVANISFVQVYDAASAKLTFTRGNDGGAYTSGSYATYPGSGVTGGTQLYQITSSTISIDTHVAGFGPITTSFSSYGGYPLLTLLHEEGHAIGLGHAGPYNGDVDEMTQQYSPYDTRLWSAMSYIDAQDTATAYYGQYPVTSNWGTSPDHYYRVPTTWMPLDILAAQRLYGLPTTTPLSGGQIFGFHTNITGDIRPYFDFTQNTVPVITLWDMGGNNTLDLSGFSTPSTVNLTPGTYSSAAGLTANIAIAFGTMIDTFIGGSGNDTVWGNGDVNYLHGGSGNDTLYGTGNDYLYGEAGNDTLVAGGAGDFAVYSGATGSVTIDLTVTGGQTTGDGFDTLTGIRNVIGSDYNDNLRGNTADNILFGGLGSDTIDISDGGNDTVHGDAGDDIIRAGAFLNAADVIDGGAGQDLLILSGNYTYTFAPGNLTGIESIRLDGGASYDLTMTDADLPAGGVLEIVSNQGSADHLRFNGAAETDGYFILRGGPGDDDLTGGGGDDTLDISKGGNDIVHGGGGNDQITALNALTAADVIDGGQGSDTLTISGNYNMTIGAANLTNVERLVFGAGTYDLTTVDANVAAGQTLTVDAANSNGSAVRFDGHAETNGTFNFIGGTGGETFIGGAGNDSFSGNDGNDTLDISAGGNDTVDGGAGDDTIKAGAALTAADHIDGGSGSDTLALAGNYALTLTTQIFTGIEAISLAAGYDYDLTLVNADVLPGQTLYVYASDLGAGDNLVLRGQAVMSGLLRIFGGAGSDTLVGGGNADALYGGAGNDTIDMSAAGNDTVSGDVGDDTILAGTYLNSADVVDGGAGTDRLVLAGNYNLVLTAAMVTQIEVIALTAGFNYVLSSTGVATSAISQTLTVDGSALAAANSAVFDGSGDNGRFIFRGGVATERYAGSAQNDRFEMGGGLKAADTLNGLGGTDTLALDGDYAALVLGAATVTNIEIFTFATGHDYNVTTVNATVTADTTLTVDGSVLGAADSLVFNGRAELDGHFTMTGGMGADTLTGGMVNDQLNGGGGNDTLDISRGGNDTVHGGDGDDLIVAGSQLTAADVIDGGSGNDTLSFAARGITFGATTIQNVETLQLLAGGNYTLITNDANVAANQRLTVEGAALGATDILTFNGSAETNGFFTVNGGAGNDSLIGGKLADILNGGGGNDTINLAYGGDDTVNAGAGDDTILALAQMTAADNIDGGDGFDTLSFAGRGMTFTATTVRNIEKLVLTSGNYALITNDATVAAGARLVIDATALTHASTVSVNGMAELDGAFTFLGGAGKERYLGGQGDDLFQMGAGFSLDDTLDGRGGSNTLSLDGDYHANMTLGASTLLNIQTIDLAAGHSYSFTTNTATVAGNANLTVNGALLGAGDSLTLNGAAETNGSFTLTGGAGGDTLIGGNRADVLTGGGGKDMLTGGAGADIYRYNAVSDSTGTNYDVISGFDFGGVAHDLFDLTGTIVGVGAAVNAGTLSAASFDSDLTAAISAARLSAQYAVLFTPNAGDLAGHTFLIADANGSAGYQAAGDYVFDLAAPVRTNYFAVSDFG